MKLSLVNVIMLGSGIILLYSGIKSYDPRDVIRYGLGGNKPSPLKHKSNEIAPPQSKPPELGGPEYPGDKGLPPSHDPWSPASYPTSV